MINKGKTELRFWFKDGVEVGPAVEGAKEIVFKPGEEITVLLSDEQKAFLEKTGHIGDTFKPSLAAPQQ